MMLIILLYALCASTFTLCKAALLYAPPFFYVGIRMVTAGLVLYGYYRTTTHSYRVTIDPRDWGLFLRIVLFHIYLTFILDLWALQFMSSIESAFIYNLSPFISAIFSYLWFNEHMTIKKFLGLFIGFCSIIPLLYKESCGYTFSISCLVPAFAMMFAAASSAYGWIIMRELVKHRNYSPFMVNGLGMLAGGVGALITSYGFENWSPTPVTNWPAFIAVTGAIIITGNILFYNLYGYLLTKYTATFLSFAGFLCSIFAAFYGWLFLGETVTADLIFSVITIVIGLYLFYQEELRQGYFS